MKVVFSGWTGPHSIVGLLLFTTNCVLAAGATVGFGNMELDPTINKSVLVLAWIHLYMIIPLAIYVTFFTKFHMPFKRDIPKEAIK